MTEFTKSHPSNPKPGVIFERSANGEHVVLNPDITVTVTKDGLSRTIIPSFDTWDTWQVDCFDALTGAAPHIQLGEVGIRMGANYEAKFSEAMALRSSYAA